MKRGYYQSPQIYRVTIREYNESSEEEKERFFRSGRGGRKKILDEIDPLGERKLKWSSIGSNWKLKVPNSSNMGSTEYFMEALNTE